MSIIEITLPANKFDPYFRKSKRDDTRRDAPVAEPKITQIRPRKSPAVSQHAEPPLVVLEPIVTTTTPEAQHETTLPPRATQRAVKPILPAPTVRVLIIAYEGRYLGRYRSSRRINHRTAYRAIHRELSVRMGVDFDPRKISLFKLVPIAIENAIELASGPVPDTVEWFPT